MVAFTVPAPTEADTARDIRVASDDIGNGVHALQHRLEGNVLRSVGHATITPVVLLRQQPFRHDDLEEDVATRLMIATSKTKSLVREHPQRNPRSYKLLNRVQYSSVRR